MFFGKLYIEACFFRAMNKLDSININDVVLLENKDSFTLGLYKGRDNGTVKLENTITVSPYVSRPIYPLYGVVPVGDRLNFHWDGNKYDVDRRVNRISVSRAQMTRDYTNSKVYAGFAEVYDFLIHDDNVELANIVKDHESKSF